MVMQKSLRSQLQFYLQCIKKILPHSFMNCLEICLKQLLFLIKFSFSYSFNPEAIISLIINLYQLSFLRKNIIPSSFTSIKFYIYKEKSSKKKSDLPKWKKMKKKRRISYLIDQIARGSKLHPMLYRGYLQCSKRALEENS